MKSFSTKSQIKHTCMSHKRSCVAVVYRSYLKWNSKIRSSVQSITWPDGLDFEIAGQAFNITISSFGNEKSYTGGLHRYSIITP